MLFLEGVITFKKQIIAIVLVLAAFMGMKMVRDSVKSFDDFAKGPMPYRTMAKKKLRLIKKQMESAFDKTSNYKENSVVYEQFRTEKYYFGDIDRVPKVKEFCSNCVINPGDYLIAGIANLDDDPEMDVITINEEGVISVLSDDIAESKDTK